MYILLIYVYITLKTNMDIYYKLCTLRPIDKIQLRTPLSGNVGVYSTYNDKVLKYNNDLYCFKKKRPEVTGGGHTQKIIII